MKTKEIRMMGESEKIRHLAEARERVRHLRFSAHGEGLKNVRALRKAKREVAQLATILKEKA